MKKNDLQLRREVKKKKSKKERPSEESPVIPVSEDYMQREKRRKTRGFWEHHPVKEQKECLEEHSLR